jgi:hypothetical protein
MDFSTGSGSTILIGLESCVRLSTDTDPLGPHPARPALTEISSEVGLAYLNWVSHRQFCLRLLSL